jgi:hypothetical protein
MITQKMLGLKTDYNFKEVRIFLPRKRTVKDIHDKIFLKIIPVIEVLEQRKLINGFHFILHEHIDLRLSCKYWEKKEYIIADILKVWGISDPLVPWFGLDPNLYGGEAGVSLCYNNLEFNSRLVMGIIQANYTGDREPHRKKRAIFEQQRYNFVYTQFPHYLRAQFGIQNALEAQIDLGRFWDNIRIVSRIESKLQATKVFLRSVRRVFLK